MNDLSCLGVHGARVWEVGLGLAFFAGLVLAWFLPQRALGRRATRVLEALGEPEKSLDSAPRGTPIVLSGTVCTPGGSTRAAGAVAAATVAPEGVELFE